MQAKVSDVLDDIYCFLQKWKCPVCDFLNSGIREEEVKNKFVTVGLKPTDGLIDLYSWRNGTVVKKGTMLDDVQIIPGFHFLSIEDSIAYYLELKNEATWCSNWFPIFANGGGDFYAVNLDCSISDDSPIICFLLGESDHEIEYENLLSMMLTYRECYNTGIVYLTNEGYIEIDDDKHAAIAQKYNPSIEFWCS